MRPLTNYPGTEDRFTADILLRKWILAKFQEIYESLGYHLVETPNLEPSEILAKEGGTGDQPTFVFEDKHKDMVCLKPDQTVSLRRVIEQHQVRLPFPRHQVGLAFRQDKPEKGRWREFMQCDADVIGAPAGIPDAETVYWLQRGFQAIGLAETVLYINARTVLGGLYRTLDDEFYDEVTFTRAIDKCPTSGDTAIVTAYLRAGHGRTDEDGKTVFPPEVEEASSKVTDLIKALLPYRDMPVKEAVAKFETEFPSLGEEMAVLDRIIEYCEMLGVDMEFIRFDPSLARGMDYYTGPVFEARNPLWPYGSLAGGGRYDRMIKVREEPQPAVGASFGLDRIEQALKDLGRVPEESKAVLADVMIVTRPDWMPGPVKLARQLRQEFKRVLIYPDPNASLKAQTKFASHNRIPVVIFYGPDEQVEGMVTLRSVTFDDQEGDVREMRKSKNVQVPLADIVAEVRAMQEES